MRKTRQPVEEHLSQAISHGWPCEITEEPIGGCFGVVDPGVYYRCGQCNAVEDRWETIDKLCLQKASRE